MGQTIRGFRREAISCKCVLTLLFAMPSIVAGTSSLRGKVALVTGASRGIGRGIALGLAEQGAHVYVSGRSLTKPTEPELGGTLESLVAEMHALGGSGTAIACDHRDDVQVEAVLAAIDEGHGRLDVLVNNAFAVPKRDKRKEEEEDDDLLFRDFWEQPGWFWDSIMDVGLRSHYVCSALAVPLLRRTAEAGAGTGAARPVIMHVSSFGGVSYSFNVAYGVGKAAVDRMAKDMSRELQPLGVDCLSLWPGVVRTEKMEGLLDRGDFERRTGLYYPPECVESPLYTGRVAAALSSDTDRSTYNGAVSVVAEVARKRGIVDRDGGSPPSIRSLRFLLPAVILGRMGREKREGDAKGFRNWLVRSAPDILLPMAIMAGGAPAPRD